MITNIFTELNELVALIALVAAKTSNFGVLSHESDELDELIELSTPLKITPNGHLFMSPVPSMKYKRCILTVQIVDFRKFQQKCNFSRAEGGRKRLEPDNRQKRQSLQKRGTCSSGPGKCPPVSLEALWHRWGPSGGRGDRIASTYDKITN